MYSCTLYTEYCTVRRSENTKFRFIFSNSEIMWPNCLETLLVLKFQKHSSRMLNFVNFFFNTANLTSEIIIIINFEIRISDSIVLLVTCFRTIILWLGERRKIIIFIMLFVKLAIFNIIQHSCATERYWAMLLKFQHYFLWLIWQHKPPIFAPPKHCTVYVYNLVLLWLHCRL